MNFTNENILVNANLQDGFASISEQQEQMSSDTLVALYNDPALAQHVAGKVLAEEWVAKLFAHMGTLYGAQFQMQWRDADPGQMMLQWSSEIGQLPADAIRRGLVRLPTCTTPPNLPRFLHLCKPAIDPESAFFEAVAGVLARENGELGKWSDPDIYWAAVAIGAFDLKTHTYEQIRSRWEAALAAEQASPHMQPIPFPAPVAADTCSVRKSPAAARKFMSDMHATISQSRQAAPDHKRWARRIQSRIAEGDGSVTEWQAAAAKKALK